jgi:hypothetical protein
LALTGSGSSYVAKVGQKATASQDQTTSSTLANVSGMTITVTPTSSSNVIQLTAFLSVSHYVVTGSPTASFQFARGGTLIGTVQSVGLATTGSAYCAPGVISLVCTDSPATTSAVTYTVQWAVSGGNSSELFSNAGQTNASGNYPSCISYMSYIEHS